MPFSTALIALLGFALQQAPPAAEQPKVRIQVVNVCMPGAEQRKQLAAALERVPLRSSFADDYEVARGRTSSPDVPVSDWVRVRREFPAASPFLTVQYTISVDHASILETLVLRLRESKNLMQVSLESHNLAAGNSAGAVAAGDAPATRIKVERFGQPSITLSRCEAGQAELEPVFNKANIILARYRAAMGLRNRFRDDIRRLDPPRAAPQAAAKPNRP